MALEFPAVHFYQYDTDESYDPVGTRHIPDGCPNFVKELGSGSISGLDFGNIKVALQDGGSASVTARSKVQAVVFGNSTSTLLVSNMRMFVSEHSALQTDWSIIQYATSGIWQPNPIWPSGIHDELTKQVPSDANLFRQDGGGVLFGKGDSQSSEYIYLNIIASKDHPLGQYGAGFNSKELRITVIFDYGDF